MSFVENHLLQLKKIEQLEELKKKKIELVVVVELYYLGFLEQLLDY